MSNYARNYTIDFLKHVKKIQRDFLLQRRLKKKIEEILKNPYHYKPLRNALKNRRRTHFGSFVLIFEVQESEKAVVFHALQYHDEAYKKSKVKS